MITIRNRVVLRSPNFAIYFSKMRIFSKMRKMRKMTIQDKENEENEGNEEFAKLAKIS
jgi:hypothetical protein